MAISADTDIPTKRGFVKASELKVGDIVYDIDGNETQITRVEECSLDFRIKFNFGATEDILVSPEQILVGYVGSKCGAVEKDGLPQYITAIEVFSLSAEGYLTKFIPVTVQGSGRLEIDPWLLGLWLGDGSKRCSCIATHVDDLNFIIDQISKAGYGVGAIRHDTRNNQKGASVNIRDGFKQQLRDLNLINNKHIPETVFGLEKGYRIEILRGLIDSDGNIEKQRGRVNFTNTNYNLAIGCARLASSLGELVHISSRDVIGFGRKCHAFMIGWTPIIMPVRLPRKVSMFKGRKVIEKRTSVHSEFHISLSDDSLMGHEIETESGTLVATNYYIPIGAGHQGEISRDTANKLLLSMDSARTFSEDKHQIKESIKNCSPVDYKIQELLRFRQPCDRTKREILIDDRLYKGYQAAAKAIGCSVNTISRAIAAGKNTVWGHSFSAK